MKNNNDKKLVSQYLLDNIDLWLFDFDDTLIDTRTYFIKSMHPDRILKRTDFDLNQEVPSWRYFRKLIQELVKHGKRIGIVSFGIYPIIKAYMDRIFGREQKYFGINNIIAVERDKNGYVSKLPENKNEFADKIMKYYRLSDYNRVVLFDDSMTNISDAYSIGIIGYKIPRIKNNNDNKASYLFNKNSLIQLENHMRRNEFYCDNYNKSNMFGYLGESKKNNKINYNQGMLAGPENIIESFSNCSSCMLNGNIFENKLLLLIIQIILIIGASIIIFNKGFRR